MKDWISLIKEHNPLLAYEDKSLNNRLNKKNVSSFYIKHDLSGLTWGDFRCVDILDKKNKKVSFEKIIAVIEFGNSGIYNLIMKKQ